MQLLSWLIAFCVLNLHHADTTKNETVSPRLLFQSVDVEAFSLDSLASFDLVEEGIFPLNARLVNLGPGSLTQLDISWSINGQSQGVVNWTGNVADGDSFVVNLGNVDFVYETRYELEFSASLPNNSPDLNPLNDTLQVGPLWVVPDAEHFGLDLDGTNDYVELADESAFDFTNSMTVEAWVRVDQFNKAYQAIVDKGDNSWRIQRNYLSSSVQFHTDNISGSPYLNGTISINDGRWHHIAGVYDGSNKYIYVDGQLDVSGPASGNISNSSYPVYIGETRPGYNRFFDGQIDEVRIWNVGRTQAEIQDWMYRSQGILNEPGLVARYHFGANQGTTAYDWAGQHHGTLINGPAWVHVGTPVADFAAAADAGIGQLLSQQIPFAGGGQDVVVALHNYGGDTVTQVNIPWQVNGLSQTALAWNGTLAPGEVDTVLLGTYAFNLGTAYELRSWTELPNGQADLVNSNDTLRVSNLYAALDGDYTIGGSNPDFATFNEAVNVLNTGGIADTVNFNVRSGTYTEQIRIPDYPGSDCQLPVTFRSETGDSSDVILQFNAPSNANYVVLLDGADGLRFENLTLQSLPGSYNIVVYIRNGANCNVFQHCHLKGPNTSITNDNRSVIFSQNNLGIPDTANHFLYNLIEGGSLGIRYYGPTNGLKESGTRVEYNTFLNNYFTGPLLFHQEEAVIRGNEILTNTSYSEFYGMGLFFCTGAYRIEDNQVYVPNGRYGIQLYQCTSAVGEEGVVANNFISMEGSAQAYGIYTYYTNRSRILNNSVWLTNTNTTNGHAFRNHYGSQNEVLNNIFYNSGGGYAFYTNVTNGISLSDYNNLYTNGPNLAYWAGNYPDLASFKAANGMDANSLSVNPYFSSINDLHVAQSDLDSAGTVLAAVNTDIDGELRDASFPDIGADEFTLALDDAGIETVDQPTIPFLHGNQDVYVSLKNYGQTPLSAVTIKLNVNNNPALSYNWTGNLLSGDSTQVNIGTFNFAFGQAYNLLAWTESPNGQSDPVAANDTSALYTIWAGLAGTYTIGGSNPDFASFSDAAEVLNNGGIVDSVNFSVLTGIYTEQIRLIEFPGSDCQRPVTFRSETGDSTDVVLQFNSVANFNYVVWLDGADGLRFQNLTLQSLPGNYNIVAYLDKGASCNSFLHCHLKAPTVSTTSDNSAVVFSHNILNVPDTANHFLHNLIEGGSLGMRYYGPTNGLKESGTRVEHNTFRNNYFTGPSLHDQDSVLIRYNTIQTNTAYSNFYGIYLAAITGAYDISGNRIYVPNGRYGIHLDQCNSALGEEAIVANNFVSMEGSDQAYGIYTYYTNRVRILNNSVWLTNTNASNGHAFRNHYGSQNEVLNNIFYNTGGGYAYYTNVTNGISLSDYNNLYSSGPNLGYWAGNYPDLTSFQAANGMDIHSLSVDPYFSGINDLHVGQFDLDSAATPLAAVGTDIDGELRDATHPDIGADEFDLPTSDAGIVALLSQQVPCLHGAQNVEVLLRNFGSDTLQNVQIQWTVDDTLQNFYNWNGFLPPGDSANVVVGNYDFQFSQAYAVKSWTTQPNAQNDPVAANDTIEVTDLWAGLAGAYTIGGNNPDFVDLNAAALVLRNGGAVDSTHFGIRSGTYNEQFYLNQFPGSNCNTPVVFQSESGDSSDVIIQFSASNNANYLVLLDGADGVKFRNLTFEALSNSYGINFFIRNGSNCNEISHCELIGRDVNSTSNNYAVIYSPGGDPLPDNYNVIRHNRILEGSAGLRWYGPNSSTKETGNIVADNQILESYWLGSVFYFQNGMRMTDNLISSANNYTDYYGIYLQEDLGDFVISRNQIYGANGRYGIYLYDCGTNGSNGFVSNNFVTLGGTSYAYGIYTAYCDYVGIWHNSVLVNSTHTNLSRAYYNFSGSQLEVQNNVFANTGGGYAYYSNPGSSITLSNHNNLYATGSNLGYWNGDRADLAAWQTASGQDNFSLSVDPFFNTLTDLHTTQVLLNAAGTPIPAVPLDIDGQNRDPFSPDIGADEFSTDTADAAISLISGPLQPFPAGANPVSVILLNNAIDTLSQAIVQWEVNQTTQPAYSWTGVLPPGGSDTLTIGSFSFPIATPHQIRVWVELPNGLPDQYALNDTAQVDSLYAGLGGTYTIGGSNPDFPDFQSSLSAMIWGGVVDSVLFNVRPGLYQEALSIPAIDGASFDRSITYQSELQDSSTVVMQDSSTTTSNYVLELAGADHFRFRHLTMQALGTNSNVVYFNGNSAHLEFSHNRFVGVQTTGYNVNLSIFINALGAFVNDLLLAHNRFENGDIGISLRGFSNQYLTDIRVFDNTFVEQSKGAIRTSYLFAPKISHNRIASTNGRNDYEGMYLFANSDSLQVIANRVQSTNGSAGVYLNNCDGHFQIANRRGLVANNFIQLGGTQVTVGLRAQSSDYLDLVYNNVNLTTLNVNSYAAYLNSNYSLRLQNNILVHAQSGYALYTNYPSQLIYADHNNYHTANGTRLILGPGNYPNLGSWQAASGLDANSFSVDPFYSDSVDLHVAQIQLEGQGAPYFRVNEDIDGDPRDPVNPDIGADEFTNANQDVGISLLLNPQSACDLSAADTVKVQITNFGATAQTGFSVGYVLNGAPAVVESIGTLSIPPGGAKVFAFTTTGDFSAKVTHQLSLFTLLPGDIAPQNDSLLQAVVHHPDADPVTGMVPVDGAIDQGIPTSFSWAPSAQATAYQLFVWPQGSQIPAVPTQTTSQINATVFGLQYGMVYNWQVYAVASPCATPGPLQTFTTRHLPDLVVDTVIVPIATVFSGQNICASWRVRNQGLGTTGSQTWSERLYLSNNLVLDPGIDLFLGNYSNLTALGPGDTSSLQTACFNLPECIYGPYFVIVVVDYFNNVLETDNSNNQGLNPTAMQVDVSPKPDLQVSQAYIPGANLTASGDTLCMFWEVINQGDGPTLASSWYDRVYLLSDSIFDTDSIVGSWNFLHQGILDTTQANNSYSVDTCMVIPITLNGTYYVFVETDVLDGVEECSIGDLNEQNNLFGYDSLLVLPSPTPNLVVQNISGIPASISTQQSFTVSWQTANLAFGMNGTATWQERVYATSSLPFGSASTTILFSQTYTDSLTALGSFNHQANISIPASFQGSYYLCIEVDVQDQVYEFNGEGDNLSCAPNSLLVLRPDLLPVQVSYPALDSTGHPFLVSWWTKNQGPGELLNNSFTDRVYWSPNPTPFSLNYLGQVSYQGNLASGDSLSRQLSVSLPNQNNNPVYLYVITDYTNQIQEANELNNTAGGSPPLALLRPDLAVNSIGIPGSVQSADTLNVSWIVENLGGSGIQNGTWVDRVFLSTSATFPSGVINLGTSPFSGTLWSGDNLNRQGKFLIPYGLSGTYYVGVYTDHLDQIQELGLNGNNTYIRPTPLNIINADAPDLVATIDSLSADTLLAGAVLNVHFTVENQGDTLTLSPYWYDRVYLSPDPNWTGGGGATQLVSLYQGQVLNVGQSYHTLSAVNLSLSLATGQYYVYVRTDATGLVYEAGNESNNFAQASIFVQGYPPIDLEMLQFNPSTDTAETGDPISLSYQVVNTGQAQTLPNTWNDAVYLSNDAVLDGSDQLLQNWTVPGFLGAGMTYSFSQNLIIPNGLDGDYYLIGRTDRFNVNQDPNLSNNYLAAPIHIDLTPPPDLLPVSFTAPATATSGQPFTISWNVSNTGVGPTLGNGWVEGLYLSTDFVLDASDQLLATKTYSGSLGVGQSYTDSLTFFMPINLSGNGILLFKTDAFNQVFEYQAENNNVLSSAVFINQPNPAELVVSEVLTVDTAFAGKNLSVQWTVKNEGVNPAQGFMQQTVYLSPDTLWNASDVLLGVQKGNINLSPGDSANFNLTGEINGVTEGEFYALVRTDVLNNIVEESDTNNLGYSDTVQVVIPILPLDVVTADTLQDLQELYYRTPIDDSLAGESMVIRMQGDSLNGLNEIFVRRVQVPSRSQYDQTVPSPFQGNQTVIVPDLLEGTYYSLFWGQTSAGSEQPVSLLAEILPFEIREVMSSYGGNTGPVTVKIMGSQFRPNMEIRLEDDSLGTLIAQQTYYIDPTVVFATFNLVGTATGYYDVVAMRVDSTEARLPNGFEIQPGPANGYVGSASPGACNPGVSEIGQQLQIVYDHPATTRPNRVNSFTIFYENIGNIDLPIPTRIVVSNQGAPLGFTPQELVMDQRELFLEFTELGSPPGILRPGGRGSVTVYTKSIAPMDFTILE